MKGFYEGFDEGLNEGRQMHYIIPAKHPNNSMRTPQEQVQMQVLLKEQTQVEQHCLDQIQQAPVSVALILAVCIRRSNSGGLKTSWQVYSPGASIYSSISRQHDPD